MGLGFPCSPTNFPCFGNEGSAILQFAVATNESLSFMDNTRLEDPNPP